MIGPINRQVGPVPTIECHIRVMIGPQHFTGSLALTSSATSELCIQILIRVDATSTATRTKNINVDKIEVLND